MRVAWRSGLLRRLGRRARRVATGTGVLALAVPLAWPSGGGGQHLDVPSAASVRSGVVHLADFVAGRATPAPTVPVQQAGTAAGKKHLVPASKTSGLKHATGHAPGEGKGQVPAWSPHRPSWPAAGSFTAPGMVRGFDQATSTPVASGSTATSVLYKNADGSYTRKVFQSPVNYKTSSGSWAAIDTSLAQGTGGRWREKANAPGPTFAAAGNDPSLVTMENASGSESVSYSLAGAGNVAGSASGSSVTYPGILPGTNVTETATATGISESLTLDSPAAGTSWLFPLKLTGLTASLDGDAVDLSDSSGAVVWEIPPATARSGPVNLATADSQASSVLKYQLVTYQGGPALEMTLDPSWLDAPGRVFPVTIDPSLSPNPEATDYAQSLNGTAQTANNSGSEFLPSGTVTDSNGTFKDIDFLDFSQLGTDLPGQHITAASLHLFDVWAYQCTYSEDVYAYQVTGAWRPGVALTYPGPAYGTKDAQWTGTAPAAACSNTSGLPGQGGWITLPFNSSGLGLLNDWTDGSGVNNYGFALAPSLTDEQMWKQFDSANDGSIPTGEGACSGNCEPYLQLTYTGDIAPQVDSQFPPDNYDSPTLTPELIAYGKDPDGWPGTVTYKFTVYDASGVTVTSSGSSPISSSDWTVPAGALAWGKTYYWTVQSYDGVDYSAKPQTNWFSTPVPQPLITSQLSQNPAGPGFGPETGNWTTSATDASVATAGPALEITRDYNSADPRRSGVFGAGWSSVLDMKVTPGEYGEGGTAESEVVTYPDGQDIAFGLNSDGSTYSPPPGRYAVLATASGGGFTLTDKNDTVYAFAEPLSAGGYGISSITDAEGRAETFTWNGTDQVTTITAASGRSLHLTWGWPSGADYSHVASVATDDATAGDASTAQDWTYQYSGDELTAACLPASTTACTAYEYTSGSDYPDAVLDSGPRSYWRLDEASGDTAASSVLANEHADDARYAGVALGQDGGPLAGATTPSASFNGSSSYVTLPSALVSGATYQSISLWFKTATPDGVLFSYQNSPITAGSTTARFVPAIYIGSDGLLNAQYWNGTAAPMKSTSPVDDGQWHQVTLTAAGNTQTLYVDGAKVGALSGAVDVAGMANNYIGSGYIGGGWPDEQYNGSSTAYPEYFNGDISNVAFWTRELTPNEAVTLYADATRPAALLSKVTRPSGSVDAQVVYDPLTGWVTSDTDANGGTWQVHAPTVNGSSQVFVGSVLDAWPQDYWRLNDLGGTQATNQTDYCGCGAPATYYNVTEGESGGPFTDAPVASFGGTNAYLDVPVADSASGGPGSVGVWFKTTGTSEMLYSEENGPVTGSAPSKYNPVLYIGTNGKLNGEFWNGGTAVAVSKAAVNDGKWHYAVLAAGSSSQSLYVDGTLQGTISGGPSSEPWTNVAAGAGFLGGSWPDISSSTVSASWFNGDLAELAWYPYQLSGSQVADQWGAAQQATGATPVQASTVTDPGGNKLTWTYDLLNDGRTLSYTNAEGGTTTYGYDQNGFQDQVTDPDGHTTTTGYDDRGNRVSKTTCQDQANNECSTSYWTYYPAGNSSAQLQPDPRNDLVLTYADGRSASATDTTYQTRYAYDAHGNLTGVVTPPVTGYPSGRTTSYAYTDGTTSAGGYQGAVPPKGLPYTETTPGGAVTATLYYADGDVAQVTTPDGQRTDYAYDGLGRKASQTVYSDSYPGGLVTTYAYDADGRLVTQTDPGVTDRVTGAVHTAVTTTAYDPDGDVLSATTADTTGGDASRTVSYAYNDLDQVTSETDATGAKTSYTYDAYGNKASETDPDGNVTQYTYDGDGHLLTTTLEGYTGSPPGSQAAAPLVEESRSYDPAGRLAQVDDAMGRQTWYTYLDNGLVSEVDQVSPDESEGFAVDAYAYDGAGDMTQDWKNNWKTEVTDGYDADGRVTQQVLDPSGLERTTSTTYTPDDKPATVTATGPDGVTQATSYTYDPAGYVMSQSLADPGAGGPVASFPLTQTSGTSVPDSATGGQTATATGVTWTSSGASFAGVSGQQVATPGPVLDTTGSFTVSAWVNLAGDAGDNQTVVAQAAGTASGFYLKYYPGAGKWEFMRPDADTAGPATVGVDSAGAAVTGTWTFLAGTYDANTGTITLYVDGASAGTAAGAAPVASDGPLLIGRSKWDGNPVDFFDGQIADVQVYPRALPAGQVSTLYGLGRGGGDVTTGALATTWTRDQRGLPTSMTDPDGQITNYSYDEVGQLAVTTDPTVTTQAYGSAPVTARPVTTTGYDTFGETAETEDADGNVTTYGYDAEGRPNLEALPDYTPPDGSGHYTQADGTAATAAKAYDGDGLLTSSTDPAGNVTRYAYDQLGNQVSATAPDGSVTATAYDADGEPLSVTGPTGAVTEATYDYMGRKVTSTEVERDTTSGTAAYTTSYSYDDTGGTGGGWLSHEASPDGVTADIAYDSVGEVTSVADGRGDTTSYDYDSLGRRTEVDYPDGTATITGYDPLGDVTSVQDYDTGSTVLASTSATFDGEGGQLSATDADGNSTTFTRDPAGQVTAEVQPVSATSGITTSFGYDADGHQTRYTDGDGNDWYDTYNAWGLQESRVEPATSQYTSAADSTFATSYDADGRPAMVAEPGGVTVASSYNKVGELAGQSGAGADAATPSRSFGYDAAGDLTSASTTNTAASGQPSNATSEAFTYDDRGLVLTASGTAGATTYTYDGDGQAATVSDAAGTTSYTYDNVGRLATLADPATGDTLSYSYNSDSQVSSVSYGSGNDTQAFGYDLLRRLTSDTLKTTSGTTVASISYGYDPDGHLTSENTAGLAGPAKSTYAYDQAGRLTSWGNGSTATTYGYDGAGNLTTNGAETYSYDARDELTGDGTASYAYTARGTPTTEPSPSGTVAVSFDAYGDQATAGADADTYDALGRLTAAAPAAGGTGNAFSYAGATGAIASDGTAAYTWDPSGAALVAAGAPGGGSGALALTDSHGDVVGQFAPTATSLTASRSYDPWGDVTATTGTLAGQLGYQSAWDDTSTGKDLMGARWYNPAGGDFTSADTIQVPPLPDPAVGNPRAYAGDDPLDNTDPTGHFLELSSPVGQAAADTAGLEEGLAPEESACAEVCVGLGALLGVGFFLGDVTAEYALGSSGGTAFDISGLLNDMAGSMTAEYDALTAGQVVVSGVTATVPRPAPKPRKVTINDGPTTSRGPGGGGASPPRPHPVGPKPKPKPWRAHHVQQAGKPSLPPAQNESAILGQVRQQVLRLAAAGDGAGNGGGPPAPPAAGGACPPPPGSGSGVTDPFSFIANLVSQGTGQDRQPAPGGQSFTPSTRVLLPGGKTTPISTLKPGDKVLAYNPHTGKDQPETVTNVEARHDTDLYNLKVSTGGKTEVIHTTSGHPFYDPSQRRWVPASKLKKGEHLQTHDGTPAVADGGTTPKHHDGWMWDLTIPGNNDHDFYVLTDTDSAAVLVHNSNESCTSGPGQWGPGKNHGSARAQAYEAYVTGRPVNESYYVNGVEFDGYKDGVLLDAKGEGYWKMIQAPWSDEPAGLLKTAARQLAAANGTPIEWHFAEEESANFMRPLVPGIKVVYNPIP